MNVIQLYQNNGASGFPAPVSNFSLSAPNLQDGSVGDTATGYNFNAAQVAVLFDFGTSNLTAPVSYRDIMSGMSCGGSKVVYQSSDGTTWTQRGSTTNPGSGTTTLSGATAVRYLQVVYSVVNATPLGVTDARVFDASGNVSVTPGVAAPTNGPLLTTAAAAGGILVRFTNAPSSASDIIVYRALTTDFTTAQQVTRTTLAVNTDFYDMGAVTGTKYYYWGQFVNAAGFGPRGNVSAQSPAAGALTTPTISGQLTGGYPVITVTSAPDNLNSGMHLYRTTAATATGGIFVADLNAPYTAPQTLTDTGATPGTAYSYYAVAFNGGNSSGPSNVSGPFTPSAGQTSTQESAPSNIANGTPHMALSAPTNLVVTPGDTFNTLRWVNPATLGGVNVYARNTVTSGTPNNWVRITQLAAATAGQANTVPTYFQETGLTNDVNREYYVTATP